MTLKIIWSLIYLMSPVHAAGFAIKRKQKNPVFYANIFSFFLLVFAPAIAIGYATKKCLVTNEDEALIIAHLLLTLTACMNTIIWFIVVDVIDRKSGRITDTPTLAYL